MDAAIGRLLAGLEAQGRLEDALIVVAGDHGEGFGELPERPFLHGSDVDPFATRIPLLFHGRGNLEIPAGTHDSPVALSDVSPTVLSLLDLEQGLGTGWDLAAGWKGGKLEDRPIFLEATKPRAEQTDGQWNNLQNERGVVWGEHLLMERVEHQEPPTLWRLGPPLVPQEDPVVRDRLLSALRVWDAAAPGASEEPVPAEVRPALEALGYLEPEKP